MKRIIAAILMLMAISISRSYGQQPDTVKRGRVGYIRNLLKTDSATARKVSDIQDQYKQSLKQVLNNGTLNDQQKRKAMDSLMDVKNRTLEELLPEAQRNLIIPTTERKRTWKRDTTFRRNR
jgi:hypothetical protein